MNQKMLKEKSTWSRSSTSSIDHSHRILSLLSRGNQPSIFYACALLEIATRRSCTVLHERYNSKWPPHTSKNFTDYDSSLLSRNLLISSRQLPSSSPTRRKYDRRPADLQRRWADENRGRRRKNSLHTRKK